MMTIMTLEEEKMAVIFDLDLALFLKSLIFCKTDVLCFPYYYLTGLTFAWLLWCLERQCCWKMRLRSFSLQFGILHDRHDECV